MKNRPSSLRVSGWATEHQSDGQKAGQRALSLRRVERRVQQDVCANARAGVIATRISVGEWVGRWTHLPIGSSPALGVLGLTKMSLVSHQDQHRRC